MERCIPRQPHPRRRTHDQLRHGAHRIVIGGDSLRKPEPKPENRETAVANSGRKPVHLTMNPQKTSSKIDGHERDDKATLLRIVDETAHDASQLIHGNGGSDGTLTAITQALTAENFAKVVPGMSKDDARRMFGKPTTVARYALSNDEVWSWHWADGGYPGDSMFDAHFSLDGVVTTTSRSEAPGRERH